MPVAEKICLGVNLGTCEKYGEGEQPYDWAIAAGMYTPELDNSGDEVACGCGGVERNLAGVLAAQAAANGDKDLTEAERLAAATLRAPSYGTPSPPSAVAESGSDVGRSPA